MGNLFLNWIVRKILVTKLLVLADFFFHFLTPAPVVSVLEDIGIHITQPHHKYDVICDHACRHVRDCMASLCN